MKKKILRWAIVPMVAAIGFVGLSSFTEGEESDSSAKKYACSWTAPNPKTATVTCSGAGQACTKATDCVK